MMWLSVGLRWRRSVRMRPQATQPTPSAPSGPGRSAALTRSRLQNSPQRHSAGRENITKPPCLNQLRKIDKKNCIIGMIFYHYKSVNFISYIPFPLNKSFKHYLLLANRSQEHNYRTFFLKSRNIFANKKFWSGDQTLYKYKYFPILWHQRRRPRIKGAAAGRSKMPPIWMYKIQRNGIYKI